MENIYTEKIKDVAGVEYTVSVAPSDAEPHAPKASYCQTPDETVNEYAKALNGAATLNVFDTDYSVRIDYVHEFADDASDARVEVIDYYSKTLAAADIKKTTENKWQISFVFEKHPTGYFTVRVNGEIKDFYVVTPSLKERTITDSPFAMDTALTFLLRGKDPALFGHYSAAMCLTGVNWVRERLQWKDYQIARNEDGSFEYDEEYLNKVKSQIDVIKSFGLKVLMTYSTGPKWAVENIHNLPGSETTNSNRPNTLATYDTQLAIYEATKRIAERMENQIDVIELINEPDHPAFRDLAEHYSSWLKSSALGIIDSGKDLKISMTGLCAPPNGYAFLPIMMASDVMKYCAVFNYHTHIYNHDFSKLDYVPDYGDNAVAREFHAVRELYGIKQSTWISESGLKIPQTLPTEEQKAIQAPYAATGAVQALSFGNDKYFWFVVAPYSEEGGDFSTFSGDHKPYPVIAVYAVMTDILGEAKFLGELKDLPSDTARGYLFNTGKDIVSVVWTNTGKASYKVPADARVTNLMGGEVTPVNGEIELSINPVYITYANAPADYYKHHFKATPPIQNPVLDTADYVLLTPEFEGNTFSKATKDFGHKIEDGTVINVRVVNHGNEPVTGKVSVAVPGFTVSGLDKEITVQPHAEGFIPLTLTKSGDGEANGIIVFNGVFNGKACTPCAASVYSGEQPDRKVSRGNWNISFEKTLVGAASILKSVTTQISNFKGTANEIEIVVDGERFTGFKFNENAILDMDLSFLDDGKHKVSVGFRDRGGDLRLIPVIVRYNKAEDTVVFTNKR